MIVGRSSGLTDTGRKRRRNEDAFVLAPPLFAIADGMGGAQAGEVASKLAAAALEESDRGQISGADDLVELIQEANRRVHARSTEDPSTSGMGTTMTVALVEDDHVTIGHVGDSRAYRVRGGRIEQLTEDHSLVNELVKSGKLSRAEAETHPQRSVITRAVGTDPDVDVETYPVETRAGDIFLLCSDGLTDMVGEDEILELLERNRDDLDRATHALVQAANRGGGEDNITVIAFEVGDGAAIEETAVLPPAAAEDEDTLDGIPAPRPRVDTMVLGPEEVAQLTVREPLPRGPRIRLVLTMSVLLLVAVLLVLWGLLH